MSLLPLTSLAMPGQRPDMPRDRRRPWTVAVSVLLHALALAVLLLARRPEPPEVSAPSYDLVFENGGSSTPPTPPDRALDTPSEPPAADLPPPPVMTPPEPTPMPEAAVPEPLPPTAPPPAPAPLPEPTPMPVPEPAPTPETPPELAPLPQAVPAPQAVPEPQPIPEAAPAVPAPAPSEPATVRLAEPEPVPPPLSPQALVPDLPALIPPPPLPSAPPRPQAQAFQRPAPGFAPPIDLNYGPATARAPMPRAPGSSRSIDLSLGAPKSGPNKSEAFFDIRAANIGADWAQGLAVYWRRHRYYPQQAAQNGEDGTVKIEIVVNRLGRVESAEIRSRSGSPWLDMAALGTWRNAQLAPLPPENTDRTITIPLTINYVLLR